MDDRELNEIMKRLQFYDQNVEPEYSPETRDRMNIGDIRGRMILNNNMQRNKAIEDIDRMMEFKRLQEMLRGR